MIEYITIVYEIVNNDDWVKSNPLKYEHNGLKAVGVSRGDLMDRVETLERDIDKFDLVVSNISIT